MNTDKKPFWVNAETVMKLTGFDKRDLERLRRDNPGFYEKENGRYLYNANAIPEALKKKETA